MRFSNWFGCLLGAVIAALSACAPPDDGRVRRDLLADLALAKVTGDVEPTEADAGARRLRMGPDAELELVVWAEAGSELVVEGGAVTVEAETDVSARRRLAPRRKGRNPRRFDLDLKHGQPLRLVVRAGSEGDELVALELLEPTPPARAPQAHPSIVLDVRPNIVVYLIDTLRADHLGCYGYPRPTSPNLDAFATNAFRFEDAVAQSSWTKSAVASIFTGLLPSIHGANGYGSVLSSELGTLAEELGAAGYRTAAFATNPNITAEFGFDQGFDDFFDLRSGGIRSPRVQRAFERWLKERSDSKPFFAYVHTVDPHLPYAPPESFRRRFAPQVVDPALEGSRRRVNDLQSGRLEATDERVKALRDLYDGEIAANDDSFGRLLRSLEAAGEADGTVVVVVSDHGEEFNEHGGFTHGKKLFNESVRVPLLISLPGHGGGVISQRVDQVDLYPTLLEIGGAPLSGGVQGRSLVPLMAGGSIVDRPSYAYVQLVGPPRLAIWDRGYKRVETRRGGAPVSAQLFERSSDADERSDLTSELPVRADYLATELQRLWLGEGLAHSETVEIDAATRAQLEALGYLQ